MSCQAILFIHRTATGILHDLSMSEFVKGTLYQLCSLLDGHTHERFIHYIIRLLLGFDISRRIFARYVRPLFLYILFERKEFSNERRFVFDVRLQLGKDLFLHKRGWVDGLMGNIISGSG